MVRNKSTLVSGIFCLFASLVFMQGCSFSEKTAQRYYNRNANKTYDMIAVPGITYYADKGWDSTMKARVYWAKFLYDKGIAKNIMFSGAAVESPYYEGEIMAMYAIALGIPKEHVFAENKAQHSTENLYYVYLKSKKLGFTKLALATDPYQAKQLRKFAKKRIGEDVGIIPIVFDTLRKMSAYMINPKIDFKRALDSNFVSLKVRESFWKRLRGTMGKNINYNAY